MPTNKNTETTNIRDTTVINIDDRNLPQPSVALNQQTSNTGSESLWSRQSGHQFANDGEHTARILINIEEWNEAIAKTHEERTTVLENAPAINTAQLNPGEIEENIYQREEINDNFQDIINETTNLVLPDILNRQNIGRAWSNQLQAENNQELENWIPERINNEIPPIENNVIERTESRIENVNNHEAIWRRINNVLSVLENPIVGSFTAGVIITLGGLILRGVLQNSNSSFSNRISNLFRSPSPTSPNPSSLPVNPSPQIQSQPEINQPRITSEVSQQSGISHLPISEISEWN
jgi:hypothetical protein